MALTAAQLSTLKSAILADTNLASARSTGDHGTIAAYYNDTGANSLWRPDIQIREINTAIVWSEFITLSVQTQNAYFALVQGTTVDATNANIRNGFVSIFAGKGTLANLTTLAARTGSRFESLFSTGTILAGFVSTVYGQTLQVSDVAAAMNS